jgi:hypothetical protein
VKALIKASTDHQGACKAIECASIEPAKVLVACESPYKSRVSSIRGFDIVLEALACRAVQVYRLRDHQKVPIETVRVPRSVVK